LEQNLTFIPDHFEIAFPSAPAMENNNTRFTYLSNDLNMSAWLKNLSVRITAKGENNGTMTNYQIPRTQYFANAVDITPTLALPGGAHTSTLPQAISEANLSFSAGTAQLDYADVRFNYDRNRSNPVDPFTVSGNDTNLTVAVKDHTDTSVEGNETTRFDGSATFYYGRVRTEDLKTQQKQIKGKVLFEVYSTSPIAGFTQQSSSWYQNAYDDISTLQSGDFEPRAKRSRSSDDLSALAALSNLSGPSAGKTVFDIDYSGSGERRIIWHLDTPSWLWTSRFRDYSFDASSGCGEHPCFETLFQSQISPSGIRSGSFSGSRFEADMNSSIKKRAIKVLR
ncbi:MAG: hypothetical protein B6D59_01125, partial [Campylobacteraceae bacterium 4484_4]